MNNLAKDLRHGDMFFWDNVTLFLVIAVDHEEHRFNFGLYRVNLTVMRCETDASVTLRQPLKLIDFVVASNTAFRLIVRNENV